MGSATIRDGGVAAKAAAGAAARDTTMKLLQRSGLLPQQDCTGQASSKAKHCTMKVSHQTRSMEDCACAHEKSPIPRCELTDPVSVLVELYL